MGHVGGGGSTALNPYSASCRDSYPLNYPDASDGHGLCHEFADKSEEQSYEAVRERKPFVRVVAPNQVHTQATTIQYTKL